MVKTTYSKKFGSNVILFEPMHHTDKRGYFFELFNSKEIFDIIGGFEIHQINQSKSKSRVLRGLHFQRPPYTQGKIIGVNKGFILDVIVDIRKDSPTFGEHERYVLDDKKHQQLFIPRGFAHGFIVLSRNAEIQYMVDNYYSFYDDAGIYSLDEKLNIDWEMQRPILSDKDKQLPLFNDCVFYKEKYYWRNP